MDNWRIPFKSIYREIIDFSLKANFDNYVEAGWQPIDLQLDFTDSFVMKKKIPCYRVGWLRGAGKPVRPQVLAEATPPRVQDFGPLTN
jgi:hypothetical protein